MMRFESQVHKQRFALGVICGLLPACSLLFGLLGQWRGVNNYGWYNSISATFFANSNVCMIWSLGLCSFFLLTYKGYDLGDRIYTLVAGIAAPMIVAFPCSATNDQYIGLFATPAKISNAVHLVSAIALFGSFSLMTYKQFPKGNRPFRNTIYKTCGLIMMWAMASIGICSTFDLPAYTTMVFESVLLEAFAVAWIVKSGAFEKQRSKP